MGNRYIVTVKCPKCGLTKDDVYYAPTCGFKTWGCPRCKHVVDLALYTGISEAEASNKDEIQQILDEQAKKYSKLENANA